MWKWQAGIALALLTASVALTQVVKSAPTQDGAEKVKIVFSGGHETDARDKGRPVILIAAALGVTPEVFRDAFSRVRPAPAGTRPTPERERSNKAVLMAALGRYGITNERLDEVSNYYRYNRSRGELWRTKEATAYALVKEGKITGFEITDGGSGYSSAPTISVAGMEAPKVEVQISFDKSFAKNGVVTGITLVQEKAK